MNKKDKDNTYNSDITKDDKQALGDTSDNLRNDQGDDALLKQRDSDVDFAAEDLDIPGRASKKPKNKIKDEENKHYSLGSDDNENLEPNTSQLKE